MNCSVPCAGFKSGFRSALSVGMIAIYRENHAKTSRNREIIQPHRRARLRRCFDLRARHPRRDFRAPPHGAGLVSRQGLLRSRRAAVHWANAETLARRYPQITVDPAVLYVDEGNILTSAGRAAGLDLCLHIVRRDYGIEIANQAARRLIVAPHRSGGQAQFIPRPVPNEGDRLGDVLAWARRNLDQDLTIDRLAAQARMSRRTLIRHCVEATGLAPGEWVLQARLAEACRVLETTRLSVEQTAAAVGLGSADTLRHQFRTRLGTSPARYRSSFAA